MKIIVLGASGNIGREIVRALQQDHEIVSAGRSHGDILVDYTEPESVHAMFESAGKIDAVVAAVGNDSVFRAYEELRDEDYEYGYRRKFLAQVNLIRIGTAFVNDGGSFTLSSGFLSHYPNSASVATGPFNAAVDAFVRSTAPLLPRGLRLNVVSPAPIVALDRVGRGLVSAEQAAAAYVASVTATDTGGILRVWGGLENEPLPS
jgi:NAD(P)-dependent dehydrogenase (short-subunit alcohol dehydrogenase family)